MKGTDYKWMASLRYELPGRRFVGTSFTAFQRFCGGALIQKDPIVIVTAAHCLDGFQNTDEGLRDSAGDEIKFFIDLGRTLGPHIDNPPGSKYTISDVEVDDSIGDWVEIEVPGCNDFYIHPDWNGQATSGHDIAVIIVRDQTEIDKVANYADADVATIPSLLGMDATCCVNDDPLIAIGYGLDDDNRNPTNTLERIDLEYHPATECGELINKYYGKTLRNPAQGNDIVCASGDSLAPHNEVDTCQGDSVCILYIGNQSSFYTLFTYHIMCQGGPLFRDNNGRVEVIGVVSYGISGIYPDDGCNADHDDKFTLPSF